MGAQSDLYNTFNPERLDRGDERYYPLTTGSYLLCVSTTRNELIDYEIGLVIESAPTELLIALETFDNSLLLTEDNFLVIIDQEKDNFEAFHDHSLSDWQTSWASTHQDTDKFPEAFVPFTNRP
jgi:hypothetical protein